MWSCSDSGSTSISGRTETPAFSGARPLEDAIERANAEGRSSTFMVHGDSHKLMMITTNMNATAKARKRRGPTVSRAWTIRRTDMRIRTPLIAIFSIVSPFISFGLCCRARREAC